LQTVTPVPGSSHTRVQQPDPPLQGVPSWPQPPEGVTQRPGGELGVPLAPLEQAPEQQSSPR
jgi:hypothetical protein